MMACDTPKEPWARKSVIQIPNNTSLAQVVTDIRQFAEVKWNQVLLLQEVLELLVVLDDKAAPSLQVVDEGTLAFEVRVTVSVVEEVSAVLRRPEATL